jgi:hypothetical protein
MMAEDSICIIVWVREDVKKQQASKEITRPVFRRREVNESVVIKTGPANSEEILEQSC